MVIVLPVGFEAIDASRRRRAPPMAVDPAIRPSDQAIGLIGLSGTVDVDQALAEGAKNAHRIPSRAGITKWTDRNANGELDERA
ncbi:hypothetical protein [Sphaerisporangium rhizosphaerae]|uniref:Uncharacterized protein n=2 Tax=Sphaerisporangium TaxID=321315 RepID=A0ABW2PCL0_9ACTN